MTRVELAHIDLPDFGLPTVEPVVPPETYRKRVKQVQMWTPRVIRPGAASSSTALVIYGDREHFANLAYLIGYDPRFEEALLILVTAAPSTLNPVAISQPPVLVVGNEGWGYAGLSPVEHKRMLYQPFSLPGQPREHSLPLEAIFREAGIQEGTSVGVVGWKYFDTARSPAYRHWLEIPAYIAFILREIVGDHDLVFNATPDFIDPALGFRIVNDVDQLAVFEFAATHTSQALRNVLFGIQPGMTEYDAVRLMQLNGMPWSAHLMLSSGKRAAVGLCSPSMKTIEPGDPVTMAYGVWGALNARAGFMVRTADELPDDIRDYVDKLVTPYFRAVVEWYQHIGIGVKGGELYDIIHQHIGDPFFGVGLNPGHFIHLDEWVHSPIYKGSDLLLKSGMALQVDVIPATGSPYFTTNIEDGIALADDDLRAEFARKYPEAWGRIQARRQFMQETLGIRLKPEVLPFSNIPAYLPPYWLSPGMAMRVRV